jgi:hypothetical protein
MFLLKRYALLMIAFFVEDTCVQIMLLLAVFMYSSAEFVKTMPVYGWWQRAIGAFNSLSLTLVYVHLIAFTDFVDDESSYAYGFSLIAVVQVFIFVNFIYMIFEFIRSIYFALVAILGLEFFEKFDCLKDQILAMKKWWNKVSHRKCRKFKIPLPDISFLYKSPFEDVIIPNMEQPETIM